MNDLTKLAAWKALQQHYKQVKKLHLRDLFEKDPKRFEKFSVRFADLLLDYSKNRITSETMKLLFQLAREAKVKKGIEKMFSGEKINFTENRAALHVALRNRSERPIYVDGQDVMPAVRAELSKMKTFTEDVRNGNWKGYTDKAISVVVNIGIDGSILNP